MLTNQNFTPQESSPPPDRRTIADIANSGDIIMDGYSSYGYSLLDESSKRTYRDILTSTLAFDTAVVTPAVSSEAISDALLCLCRDFPLISWLSRSYKYRNDSDGYTRLTLEFTKTKTDVSKELAQISSSADKIIAGFPSELSDFDKAVLCYDGLVKTVSYDDKAENQREVYGALCDKKASCEGYAKAYQYLLCRLLVECLPVYGVANEPHAWNIVELDGKFYNVDVTWGDCVLEDGGEYISHEFVFMEDADFVKSHQPNKDESNYALPECDDGEMTFVEKKGLVVQENSETEITAKLKAALTLSLADDNIAVQVGFKTKELGAQVNTGLLDGVTDSIMTKLCQQKMCGKIIGRTYNHATGILTYIREPQQ